MAASLDPQQLLCLARAGSGEALGSLLESYRNYLVLVARLQIGRRLQGKADAADLVQETFLQAHRQLGQFNGATEQEFLGWLRAILASRLAKLVRRYCGTGSRDVRLECALAAEMEETSRVLERSLMARCNSPSQEAERRELAVRLADALAQLPEHYREVLILRHLQELSFPEIAQRTGRSLDSVEKLWTRALPQLSQLLGRPP